MGYMSRSCQISYSKFKNFNGNSKGKNSMFKINDSLNNEIARLPGLLRTTLDPNPCTKYVPSSHRCHSQSKVHHHHPLFHHIDDTERHQQEIILLVVPHSRRNCCIHNSLSRNGSLSCISFSFIFSTISLFFFF